MNQLISAGALVAGLIGTFLYGFYMVVRYGRWGAVLATVVFATVVLAFVSVKSLI
jgi:hypothetical protein